MASLNVRAAQVNLGDNGSGSNDSSQVGHPVNGGDSNSGDGRNGPSVGPSNGSGASSSVVAVPETSTWVMGFLALGAVVVMVRRNARASRLAPVV